MSGRVGLLMPSLKASGSQHSSPHVCPGRGLSLPSEQGKGSTEAESQGQSSSPLSATLCDPGVLLSGPQFPLIKLCMERLKPAVFSCPQRLLAKGQVTGETQPTPLL